MSDQTKETLFSVLTCLVLSGCEKPPTKTELGGVYINNGSGAATIYEIKLSDGTRCAALVGNGKGAIDCEWKHQ